WTRIKRVGTSRKSLLQEELGYIDGGSQTLIDALVTAINHLGGEIRLGASVARIASDRGRVSGIEVDGTVRPFDAVICTVPTPFVSSLVQGLPAQSKAMYAALL